MFKTIHSKAFGKAFGLLGLSVAASVPLAFMATPAQAGTATTTFQVTATVVAGCTVSAADLAFGNYNSQATTATSANSTITLNCTDGVPFTVALDAGQNAGGASNFSARAMSDGTAGDPLLSYQLYSDSSHSTESSPKSAVNSLRFGSLALLGFVCNASVQAASGSA